LINDPLGFLVLLAGMGLIGILVSMSRLPRSVKVLVYFALALRIVGTIGRYYMVMVLYDRVGDSVSYFNYGNEYAERFWALDFSTLWNRELWQSQQWWGTQFLRNVTGGVLAFIGPTLIGGYLAFSLLAFLGLVGFGIAFHRSYPNVPASKYLRWAWLFPSLWFWPSAIGKEAILLMGLGLAIWGYVGRNERVNWLLLAIGLFFVFAVRVQVAAVLSFSMVLAQWLSTERGWTRGRITQGVLILGVGLGAIYLSLQILGIAGLEGVAAYMEGETGRAAYGTVVETAPVALTGIPMAVVNTLMRPFPWEARNPQLLITSFEIIALWCIVWFRRRNLVFALRHWRSQRLLRLAIPFVVLYTVTLGMLLANVGIIARQRTLVFPFLFILIEAAPRFVRRARVVHPAAAISYDKHAPEARAGRA
jgi:hypothetical protein